MTGRSAKFWTAAALALALAVWTDRSPAADGVGEPTTNPAETLRQFSAASQELYRKVSGTLVKVKVERNPDNLIPPSMRKEYEEFLKERGGQGTGFGQGPGGPHGPGPRIDILRKGDRDDRGRGGRREDASPAGSSPPTTGPASANPASRYLNAMLLRSFLEQRLQNAPDAETAGRIRAALQHMEQMRAGQGNEVLAAVFDAEGHALVLTGLFRGAEKKPITVVLPDGTESTATLEGTDYLRGVSLIQLDKPPAAFTPAATTRPASGELLMCVSASNGGMCWLSATPSTGVAPRRGKSFEERLMILGGDERGSNFLYNIDGQLTAIGLDRFAVPIDVLKGEIKRISEAGPRKQVGIRWGALAADSPLRGKIGDRPAVRVEEVIKGSPAEQAGVHKGDVVLTVDDRPVTPRLLWQLSADMATRTTPVQLRIWRDEKEMTLDLPLEKPKQ